VNVNDSTIEMIGHYRILKEIGKGGFGRVFLAQNTELENRIVAIKILDANHNTPKERKRFHQEAQILFDLENKYILPFIDLLPYGDHLCLIAEYAAGGSLRDRISQSPQLLPMQEVLIILSQVGQALQYIHEKNIVHCDLKPENIFFNAQGVALLADFGIAKIVAEVSGECYEVAAHGTGTPPYMAPEQIKGHPTEKSDQYAFACVAYQLLAGSTPFKGSSLVQLQQHLNIQPIDPRTLNPQIPQYIAEAILKGLAKDPADRHNDIRAFLIALGVPHTQETILSQKDIDELLDRANALFEKGHYEDAFKIYERITKYHDSAKAFCGKGDVILKRGGNDLDTLAAALEAYNQAIRVDPEYIPAYIGRGDTFWHFKEYEDALKAFLKAAELAHDPSYYLKIADICIELNKAEKALAAYDEAMRYGADPVQTRYKKIDLLKRLGRYQDVAREYDQIIRLSSTPLTACYEKRDFLFSIRLHDETFAINQILATYGQIFKLKNGAIEVYYEEFDYLGKLVNDNNKKLTIYNRFINQVPNEIKIYLYYKIASLLEQLNRLLEVPGVYDRIVELAPNDITARHKKLKVFENLGWPEDTLEDGLETCNQIIERVPDKLNEYLTKRELLWKLKRYDQVVDTCQQILQLESQFDFTYYQMGQAFEMLASIPQRTKENIFGVRLTKIHPHYLNALDAYDNASQLAPDNQDYRESRAKLLRHLRKQNQARLTQSSKSRNPTLSWLYWGASFLSLPFLINAVFMTVLLMVLQHLWIWNWAIMGVFFLVGALGAIPIFVNDKPHHLYRATILFYPITIFAIEWFMVGLFVLHPVMSASFIFSLIGFFVFGLLGNTFIYFVVDNFEEYTFVIIGKEVSKALLKLSEVSHHIAEAKRKRQEQREQESILATQIALSRTNSEDLLLEDPPTLLRSLQSTSVDEESSDKKPILVTLSKGFKSTFAKQVNIDIENNSELELDILDDYRDTARNRRRKGREKIICPPCCGKGKVTCPECGGKGYENIKVAGYSRVISSKIPCSKCSGEKTVSCDDCMGLGKWYIDLDI
jgi:tetratricopeptide (TPR) repeat protein